ncbi:MAG: glutathione synthase [Myxococcales bacterium]|nr:glutathione synthase [Myxococcales bacterium]MCB9522833.1 glutathione synthase [Myxococcales bacterium]
MKFLVVMDPIETVAVAKDTTFGFMLAAQARGHEVHYCLQDQLYLQGGKAWAVAWPVTVRAVEGDHFTRGPAVRAPLSDYDSVWMRKDPPVDRAFLHATYILDYAGTQVLNHPRGLRDANEKIYSLNFPTVIPETVVTRDAEQVKAILAERGEKMIAKPVDGHGGRGVFMLTPGDRNNNAILEALTDEGQRWIMLQAYIPEAREGDKRLLVLDGEPLGAILRVPQADDNRGNIHVGGSVVAAEVTDRDREIAAALAPRLKADGLVFVGLDIIGGLLTEVNVTSPTGIREVKKLCGVDVGDAYIAWVEQHAKR